MDGHEFLAERFEENRSRLKAVAYRMLGSTSEAEDAVQEAWIRLGRCDDRAIENLGGWLTTVVGRVCLDMLRSRRSRREEPLGTGAPEETAPGPELGGRPEADPEQQALMADSVGLAMLVVLETLDPAERLAFVLHDMFAVPFDEIAGVVDRTPAAARQLASRARRRVQGADPVPDPDLARKREIVNAFLAAARDGEFEALLTVLDPDVVVRSDTGAGGAGAPGLVRGAAAVARQAMMFAPFARSSRRALVGGEPAVIATGEGHRFSVMIFTVARGRIVEMSVIRDPSHLPGLDLAVLDD
ncbi:sigma-70 family RNA polymerase sigma factor [Streptomyces sp. NBC_00053]|uniref:sigma-70 family RNA polymerase sigma factor n=1 Tax=unclassified Streptomyces TaxID=2593676 RepID=UPI00225BE06A|nr:MULTISPECIES: sigma-70 family RNA polymerase sigma factor [unclassified Streptomyces]WSG49754.1 sigma-70 family RNA polymerase sigma factor [Streptomyces sp. NBC_01732]MCX5099505.1 sigma-70 family RNA polymerase sigma factor [Streptomyces sp. NBC_00439]MCX5159051.1 sigma-70 family RNA polymerase sigma factor [Streptomyces sp. NBC_00305]MCX5217574.1 sigma-70 family RNA polymerase sigma factor [Streptomyces sp. NBC_00264]MCX5499368.1 sigma-70 family RNA polymerase sigma factor [Streptomyces s